MNSLGIICTLLLYTLQCVEEQGKQDTIVTQILKTGHCAGLLWDPPAFGDIKKGHCCELRVKGHNQVKGLVLETVLRKVLVGYSTGENVVREVQSHRYKCMYWNISF